MCGIIKTIDTKKISLIDHRGIETKIFGVPCSSFWIGHRRLPIQTTEGDQWSQPLILKNGLVLAFVGEIFNYPEKYPNDTAYLKDLFENSSLEQIFNEEINQWDGFWAIHVEDTKRGKSYSFTDPLGKKQLYYNILGEVCSEISPLILDPGDWDTLFRSHVEKFGYSISDRTPWNHVSRIKPGKIYCRDTSSGDNMFFDYFFDFYQATEESLENLLVQSVKNRARGMNPAISRGILLSGGLDSSIITVLLKELDLIFGFDLYTIANGEDEIYAKEVANFVGRPLNFLDLKEVSKEGLQKILRSNETPIDLGSLIPLHQIMEASKGSRVILTGDGADELFGGYSRSRRYDSQESDVFEELPYYHLPRLDRASMRFLTELRSPFLSHDVIRFALRLSREDRVGKKILKEVFGPKLPPGIIERDKLALKSPGVRKNYIEHRRKLLDIFYKLDWSK